MLTRKKLKYNINNKTLKKRLIQKGGQLQKYFEETINFYEGNPNVIFNKINTKFKTITNNINLNLLLVSGFTRVGFPPKIPVSPDTGNIDENTYLEKYHSSYKEFYFFNKIKTELCNNSSIHFFNTHGSIISGNLEDTNISVPQNTLICFTSPINNLGVHLNDNKSFFYNALDLTVDQYVNLFKYRNHLRYLPNTSDRYQIIDSNKTSSHYIFSSCFKHSVWYYPGQVYPDMNLSVSQIDFKNIKEGYGRQQYDYEYIDSTIRVKEYPFFGVPVSDITSTSYNKKLEIKLSDYVNQITTHKYQIIFITACRGIQNTRKIIPLLEYEKFILNLNLYSENINSDEIKEEVNALSADLYPQINSYLDNNKFLISNDLTLRTAPNIKLYLEFKAPFIYDIYQRNINNSEAKIKEDDCSYISLLKPSELMFYFSKLKKYNKPKFKKTLKDFLKYNQSAIQDYYSEIIPTIMKNLQDPILMCYKGYSEINTALLTDIIDVTIFFKKNGFFKSISLKKYANMLKEPKKNREKLLIVLKSNYELITDKTRELRIYEDMQESNWALIKKFNQLKILEINKKNQTRNVNLVFDTSFPKLEELSLYFVNLRSLDVSLIKNIRYIALSGTHTTSIEGLHSLRYLEELKLINCQINTLTITKKLKILKIETTNKLTLNINADINSLILYSISPDSQIIYSAKVNLVKYFYTIYNNSLFSGSKSNEIDTIILNQVEFISNITIFNFNPEKLVVRGYYLSDFIINDTILIPGKRIKILEIYSDEELNINYTMLALKKLKKIIIKGDHITYKNLTPINKKTLLKKNKLNILS